MMKEDNQDFFSKNDKSDFSYDSTDSSVSKEERGRLWNGIEKKIGNHYRKKYRQRVFFKVACSVLVIGIASFWYNTRYASKEIESTVADNIIFPGSDKAILTLEDGRKVDLTSNDEDELAHVGVKFGKSKDGQIVYKISAPNDKIADGFNTITTPRGGQYRIILPDDSEVLLNASSSLRFSKNIHNQKVRNVELTGEGYFQVKKSKTIPFIVNTHGQQIRVLGTTFNVNAYSNSKVSTTLLEGIVQLNDRKILKPGEQGISSKKSDIPTVNKVEIGAHVDWVNKQFIFRDERITAIMERLGRWYDFDVKYNKSADLSTTFNGELSRYADVNDVLKLLSKTSNLEFEIKARVIYVK